ncbi:MAG: hypothetical protein H6739_36020 [Alphaproteobacteria bacterium]|nr:hypothetical protein [Alphaproteobacteria bacterium]
MRRTEQLLKLAARMDEGYVTLSLLEKGNRETTVARRAVDDAQELAYWLRHRLAAVLPDQPDVRMRFRVYAPGGRPIRSAVLRRTQPEPPPPPEHHRRSPQSVVCRRCIDRDELIRSLQKRIVQSKTENARMRLALERSEAKLAQHEALVEHINRLEA